MSVLGVDYDVSYIDAIEEIGALCRSSVAVILVFTGFELSSGTC